MKVDIYIETSSIYQGITDRKCSYVLSVSIRNEERTKEGFGHLEGTWHQAVLGFNLIWYIARKELPRGNNFKRVFCEIMRGWLLLRYITFADLCDFTLVLCAVASLVCLILKK